MSVEGYIHAYIHNHINGNLSFLYSHYQMHVSLRAFMLLTLVCMYISPTRVQAATSSEAEAVKAPEKRRSQVCAPSVCVCGWVCVCVCM
jgi:hypothetical protein